MLSLFVTYVSTYVRQRPTLAAIYKILVRWCFSKATKSMLARVLKLCPFLRQRSHPNWLFAFARVNCISCAHMLALPFPRFSPTPFLFPLHRHTVFLLINVCLVDFVQHFNKAKYFRVTYFRVHLYKFASFIFQS